MPTRHLTALTLLVLLAATGAAAQVDRPGEPPTEEIGGRVIGDGVVVPGQRIGTLRLAMSIEQILRAMPAGYKREVFARENIILYEWRTQGVWVSLEETTKRIRLISVFGAGSYTTDKGVALLAGEGAMRGAHGKETVRYQYPDDRITLVRYVPLGLQFSLVNQPGNPMLHGRIFAIGIFTPGKEPPLTKRPASTSR